MKMREMKMREMTSREIYDAYMRGELAAAEISGGMMTVDQEAV